MALVLTNEFRAQPRLMFDNTFETSTAKSIWLSVSIWNKLRWKRFSGSCGDSTKKIYTRHWLAKRTDYWVWTAKPIVKYKDYSRRLRYIGHTETKQSQLPPPSSSTSALCWKAKLEWFTATFRGKRYVTDDTAACKPSETPERNRIWAQTRRHDLSAVADEPFRFMLKC